MSEKDQDLAGGAIYQINKERRGHQMGDCAGDKCPDWITRQVAIITDVLTTVRKEAREAAFKEALDATTRVHLACGATGSADFQEGIRNGVTLGANQIRDVLRAVIEADIATPAESTRVEGEPMPSPAQQALQIVTAWRAVVGGDDLLIHYIKQAIEENRVETSKGDR